MTRINWDVTPDDDVLLIKLATRAAHLVKVQDLMTWYMDFNACHANGCPLRLQELLDAPDGSFVHDAVGIRKAINRETGKLTEDCFVPRYAR